LIAPEKEDPVPNNRPAERPAELVANQAIVLALPVGPDTRERVGRVEALVSRCWLISCMALVSPSALEARTLRMA
jgi:hypothetical protein